ncbi:hypothetical protein ACFC1T_20395 [Kitasatospora sp. NPDC056076]|uniref:hypothetical protein n=1 Tax=Kitasatospora sp. NPDC056076 TaxID=3345703 RepID=UPI0035DDB91F
MNGAVEHARTAAELVIPARYNGPDGSAHGGYACARIVALADGRHGPDPAVTLLAPLPLDAPLEFRAGERRSGLWHGAELVATVTRARDGLPLPPPVGLPAARAAAAGYLGRTGHPFPTCWACGPERAEDGLRLSPGPVAPGTVACTWTPRGAPGAAVPAEQVWGALDCPGGWVTDPRARPMVLSRMTAALTGPVRAGREYEVVAARHATHGRTVVNLTALYDADGRPLARATALWTEVRPSDDPAARPPHRPTTRQSPTKPGP